MRTPLAYCLLILCAIAPFAKAADPPAYPNHRDLLVVIDAEGKSKPVRTAADWQARRAHILQGMEQAMGPLPDRANLPPLDVRQHAELRGPNYKRLHISFAAEAGDRLTAYLYVPDPLPNDAANPADGRRAAMLALHPTGVPGKDIVAGIAGKANRQYAEELAQRGYVVIAPDYPSFGELKDYNFATDRYESGTMKGIWNHMRCVDLLVARPDVDPARIGVIGHSLGGHNAMFLVAFDPRLAATVSSCGWTPFHDYYEGKIKGWTSDRYMPRLATTYELNPDKVPFDFYEVVAALAPRAFFSASPIRDSNFEYRGVQKAEKVAREVFRLLNADERFVVKYPECEHDFPDDMRRAAYDFLDKQLKNTPAKKVP